MELPIQLKFFRKIELFQEFKIQNKRNINNKIWKTEKAILKWAAIDYVSLNKELSHDYLRKVIFGDGTNELMPNMKEYDLHLTVPLENLIARGFAIGDCPTERIKITREGILMGEVINEKESNNIWSSYKYEILYYLVWLSVIIIFFNLIKDPLIYIISLFECIKG